MGEIIQFSGKKTSDSDTKDQIMACDQCDCDWFVLSADGNIFCVHCEGRVDANWTFKPPTPAA
jgi:uncharacterized Zn finger protein (UPF0148 family)